MSLGENGFSAIPNASVNPCDTLLTVPEGITGEDSIAYIENEVFQSPISAADLLSLAEVHTVEERLYRFNYSEQAEDFPQEANEYLPNKADSAALRLANRVMRMNYLVKTNGNAADKLEQLAVLFNGNEIGTKGVEELKELFGYINQVQPQCHVELDLTLARGLNYYTGAIFEVKAHNVSIGSICGGGRYDNLTGIFGMPDVSGVGISFGADRIYDVLTELDKFPANLGQPAQALFINFGAESVPYCIRCAAQLRAAGISTLIYPDNAKMKKQMDDANRCHVPYVIFAGENEIAAQNLTVKDMTSGEQNTLTLAELVSRLKT